MVDIANKFSAVIHPASHRDPVYSQVGNEQPSTSYWNSIYITTRWWVRCWLMVGCSYLWRRVSVTRALDVATTVVRKFDPMWWLVYENWSLEIQWLTNWNWNDYRKEHQLQGSQLSNIGRKIRNSAISKYQWENRKSFISIGAKNQYWNLPLNDYLYTDTIYFCW